jgi:hypothetical protein
MSWQHRLGYHECALARGGRIAAAIEKSRNNRGTERTEWPWVTLEGLPDNRGPLHILGRYGAYFLRGSSAGLM